MKPSEEMYQRLIEPIEDRMISIVTRIIGDHHDSLDVFQEILAVIWTKLKKIDRHPNPQAYILRICMSRSYDALRRKARRRREVKQRRNGELLDLQNKIAADYNRRFVGRDVEVLVEGLSKKPHLNRAEHEDNPQLVGRTATDYIVVFNGPENLTGRFANVKITRTSALTLFGKLI